MERFLTTARRSCICIVLQMASFGTVAAQSTGGPALQMTAMLGTHAASAGAAMRRLIEPVDARELPDPEIKTRANEPESEWDLFSPDAGVPCIGPVPERVRKYQEQLRG